MANPPVTLVDELKLKPVLERVNVPSYVIDSEGVIVWLNPAASEIVGDVRGASFANVVSPGDLSRAYEAFARNVDGDRPADFDLSVVGADGQDVHLCISSTPLHEGNRVVGVFGLLTRPPEPSEPRLEHPHLTPRQLEVLNLLADGASTRQIAATLHLSVETVRNHVRAVLRGLGASSRLEAVAIARHEHLID